MKHDYLTDDRPVLTPDMFEERYRWDVTGKPVQPGDRVYHAARGEGSIQGTVKSLSVPRCHVLWDGCDDGGTFPFICRLVVLECAVQRVA